MWYLFDSQYKCWGTCSGRPNLNDLAERGESAKESELVLRIEEVGLDRNGNIIQVIPRPPL